MQNHHQQALHLQSLQILNLPHLNYLILHINRFRIKINLDNHHQNHYMNLSTLIILKTIKIQTQINKIQVVNNKINMHFIINTKNYLLENNQLKLNKLSFKKLFRVCMRVEIKKCYLIQHLLKFLLNIFIPILKISAIWKNLNFKTLKKLMNPNQLKT